MSTIGGTKPGLPDGPAALVIGHPGHELRVHGWLELARPVVFILTDGSGHGFRGRLSSTDRVLNAAGAAAGPIYGRLADRRVYELLVRGEVAPWVAMAHELAAHFCSLGTRYVLADAAEGFNPTHDLCRYITDAAAKIASRLSGRACPHFEFDLDAAPDRDDVAQQSDLSLHLDDEALDRKIRAARGYPEMRDEVEGMLARFGKPAFAVETLRPARSGSLTWTGETLAGYERHGRNRLASGIYDTLITYQQHLAPVQAALGRVLETTCS